MRVILPILILSPVFLLSQGIESCVTVLANSGNSHSEDGRYYAFTLGEPVICTLEGTSTLTQGFHQPECSIIVGTRAQELASKNSLVLFPNPTADIINVKIKAGASVWVEEIVFAVFDELGREIAPPKQYAGETFQLDCSSLPAGQYYLRVGIPGQQNLLSLPFIKQ